MITKEKHAHRVFFLRDHAERAAEVMPAVWLITANYNQTRAPAQRRRSWYGTGVIPVLCNPPRGTPRGLALGLAILLAATTLEFKIRIEERWRGFRAGGEGGGRAGQDRPIRDESRHA